MKRVFHIVLSVWLAVVLLAGSTPKEFIHLFANHIDTVDALHSSHEGLTIEPQHHHCTFLSYALPLFLNDGNAIHCDFHKPSVYPYSHIAIEVQFNTVSVHTPFLRGPPIV